MDKFKLEIKIGFTETQIQHGGGTDDCKPTFPKTVKSIIS